MKGGGHLPLKPQNRRPSFASKPLVKTNPSNAPTRGRLFARRGVFLRQTVRPAAVFREYYISFPRRTGNYLPETAPMNRRIGFVFSERCLTSVQRSRRMGSRSTPSLDTECRNGMRLFRAAGRVFGGGRGYRTAFLIENGMRAAGFRRNRRLAGSSACRFRAWDKKCQKKFEKSFLPY